MSNSHPPDSTSTVPRPEFMATLGLLPPYQAADVEKAYHAKLKQIRPDLGGDRQAFYDVQNAYMRAKEYVKIRGDRRGWIAKQVDAYVGVQEVIDRLKQFGAEIEVEAVDWLKKSFGDLAQLTESVTSVRLRDATNGDEMVEYMVSQHDRLLELRRLDLAGSTISDGSIRQLGVFRRLGELDVSARRRLPRARCTRRGFIDNPCRQASLKSRRRPLHPPYEISTWILVNSAGVALQAASASPACWNGTT
ncbi:MAG TPA: hypothetical protein VGK58_10885 [Lacipirellulaceae bacterium]